MYQINFTINELPKTRNAIADRRWTRKKESDRWLYLVNLAVGSNIPKKPLTKADLHLIRASSSMPDYDGLVSSFKYVIDALVKLNILKDDNLNVCEKPLYEWTKAKQKQGFIQVEVKEC
jgi:hypothetical protein